MKKFGGETKLGWRTFGLSAADIKPSNCKLESGKKLKFDHRNIGKFRQKNLKDDHRIIGKFRQKNLKYDHRIIGKFRQKNLKYDHWIIGKIR